MFKCCGLFVVALMVELIGNNTMASTTTTYPSSSLTTTEPSTTTTEPSSSTTTTEPSTTTSQNTTHSTTTAAAAATTTQPTTTQTTTPSTATATTIPSTATTTPSNATKTQLTITLASNDKLQTTNLSFNSQNIPASSRPITKDPNKNTTDNSTEHANNTAATTHSPSMSFATSSSSLKVSTHTSSATVTGPLPGSAVVTPLSSSSFNTGPVVTMSPSTTTNDSHFSSSTLMTSKQTTQASVRYVYSTYQPINGSCSLNGYTLDQAANICVSLCEQKKCENGGVCEIVEETPDVIESFVARCRCKETSDEIFVGESCELSKLGRVKEREITLGVLIPFVCLTFLVLVCTCRKLKRHGKAERDFRNKYNVNTGNL